LPLRRCPRRRNSPTTKTSLRQRMPGHLIVLNKKNRLSFPRFQTLHLLAKSGLRRDISPDERQRAREDSFKRGSRLLCPGSDPLRMREVLRGPRAGRDKWSPGCELSGLGRAGPNLETVGGSRVRTEAQPILTGGKHRFSEAHWLFPHVPSEGKLIVKGSTLSSEDASAGNGTPGVIRTPDPLLRR
jgi:hypothetical protein